jgi:hypothetical protein
MSELIIHFGCKAKITGCELNAFGAMLTEHGLPAEPESAIPCGFRLGGGRMIEFIRVGKDFKKPLEHTDGIFKSVTWKSFSAPKWSRDNRVAIKLLDLGDPSFSAADIATIKKCATKTLKLIENVILNENRGIKDGDLYVHICLFLHFDKTKAINDHTTPSIEFPNSGDNTRLFQCWNCKTWRDQFCFDDIYCDDGHKTGFELCLEMFNTGHPAWCTFCAYRGQFEPVMESISKRIRRE